MYHHTDGAAMQSLLTFTCILSTIFITTLHAAPVSLDSGPPSIDDLINGAMTDGQPHSVTNGRGGRLVEKDMILSEDQYEAIHGNGGSGDYKVSRIAIGEVKYRWPGGTIPYVVDDVYDEKSRKLILESMRHWEKYTCIQFVPRRGEDNYIRIVSQSGCASWVGMQGGGQDVSINIGGCLYRHIIIHELGHAIGFHHEQTRPDRDQYVTVQLDNVLSHQRFNFKRYDWGYLKNYGIKYDYLSVMHYGQYAFSSNAKRTIVSLNPKYQKIMGHVPGASLKDIQTANLMYKCSDQCDASRCPAKAILSEDCKCWCNTGNPGNPVVEWDGTSECKGPDDPSENCVDYEEMCMQWADEGMCESNSFYMSVNCRKACRVCGPGAICRDFQDQCERWLLIGECERNPAWMLTNCMKSCQACGNMTTAGAQGCRDISDMCTPLAQDGKCEENADSMLKRCPLACNACLGEPGFVCRNWHIECQAWKDFGRCQSERTFMDRNCPKACGRCTGGNIPDCQNYASDRDCQRWKDEGECANNPRWMLLNCAESCRSCGSNKVCQDRLPRCQEDKEQGYCTDEENRVPYSFYCPVSCEKCPADSSNTGSCLNFDPDCDTWQSQGWCDSNPNVMLGQCPKACNLCGANPVCKNYNEMCDEWQSQGECQTNPSWMSVHCARACDTCPEPDRTGVTGGTTPTTTPCPNGRCTDDDDPNCVNFFEDAFCTQLASQGFCDSHPEYTVSNCKKACRVCGRNAECKNFNQYCKAWADRNECNVNPGYMHVFCRQACGVCGGDGSGDVDTTVAPTTPRAGICPEHQQWCDRVNDNSFCSSNPTCDSDNIVSSCPFHCGLCGQNPVCRDFNQYCSSWASYGECERNPGYMKVFCGNSCNCC